VNAVVRAKPLLAVLAVAAVLLFLHLYRPEIAGGVPEQSVEAGLRSLGYERCGTYTLSPGDGVVTLSVVFNGEVKCFIIVKRPGEGYMFKDPRATLAVEPPSEKTVYRYSLEARFFYLLGMLSKDEDIRPFSKWGAGALNRTTRPPPPNEARAANDDIYVAFSYKPEKDGFPVKLTLTVMADVIEGRAPPPFSLLERMVQSLNRVLEMALSGELAELSRAPPPPYNKTAAQLGIKDIKVLMTYMGYDLCGEFTAKDSEEIQRIEHEIEIDPNEGKACYILIHPPSGRKAFLILRNEHHVTSTDNERFMEYIAKMYDVGLHGQGFFSTPYTFVSAFNVLELGRIRSIIDVVKPYSERSDPGSSIGLGPSEWVDNSPILIYFAYKGDTETFGEPLRFKLRAYTLVEFRIIPAKEFVRVD
jgi:hypothetical protein